MKNIFKREMKSNAKALLFWSLGMLLMSVVGFAEFSVVANSEASMSEMIEVMPRIVKVMMGMGSLSIDTPEGYYACMFLFLSLIAFVHAILLGSTIISKEENDKTAEFIFSKPIKRREIITGKITYSIINLIIMTLIAWSTSIIFMNSYNTETNIIFDINLTMLGMFITQLVFFFIGLFLSAVFKEKGKPSLYASILVLGAYFLAVVLETIKINYLDFLTPFRYFDVAQVMENGLNLLYIVFSVLIISITCIFVYKFYEKRDLRN